MQDRNLPAEDKNDELEKLRQDMRQVTEDILRSAARRMKIASDIGAVKSRRNLDVRDEKAESEIRLAVKRVSDEVGLGREFASRLLNLLLSESEAIQSSNRGSKKPQKQTHLAIFARAKALEASGANIIHMEVGEPDFPAPASVGTALVDSFNLRQYHYTETLGAQSLRRALAKKTKTSEERIIVTPGGRFAVFAAIIGLLRPGDELVVVEPAWPAYRECAEFAGASVKVLRTSFEDGWNPDVQKLADLVSPSTKMIAINYPNNPTGKVIEAKKMEQIVNLAREHKLYLLSDEVYSQYSYSPFVSALDFDYERAVAVSSFSKTYAMTGFRIGYAVSSSEIISSMKKVQAAAITSVAEPIQNAAISALKEDVTENSQIIKQRLNLVCSHLRQINLEFVMPGGGMYAFPRLPPSLSDMEFIERLLEKGVAVAPGSGFGDAYGGFIRISACEPSDALTKGLDVMASILATPLNRE